MGGNGSEQPLVLITERSETYWSLERALLEPRGYRVKQVDEAQVVALAIKSRPRLVVLALEPRGEGLELAEELRGRGDTRAIGILATGIRGYVSRDEVLRRGANRLLWKPFSPGRFVADVEDLCHVEPRHPVSFDVALKGKRPGSPSTRGSSVNLSMSGVLIWCESELVVGHRLFMEAAGHAGLVLEVEVVRQAAELGPGYYALRFRLGPEAGKALTSRFDLPA